GGQLKIHPGSSLNIIGKKAGSTLLDFRILGFIPIKSIRVDVLPDLHVYPGGQAIGVLLRSRGVMVVGESYVDAQDGKRYYPAMESGIEVGDRIIEINGNSIDDKIKLSSMIQELSKENQLLKLKIIGRNGSEKTINLRAVKNRDGIYMIGLYVDDGVAGVGTLTFYEPNNNEFGALGHEITELNSQLRIEFREGKILDARISGINSGERGAPGEKLGTFFQTENIVGEVQKNNEFGIFGIMRKKPENPYFKEPLSVATISEVREGPAKIYTVVSGGQIEEFNINIDRVARQSYPSGKGLIISITDPELKKMTGGIIQGMSGSPIVQNNKLVGAITHVFVNDPARGYGVFAQWMLLQTTAYNISRANNY
ncbi:MAG TPA: SpoIVB peptidase, partial [Halanaerobiales bacterium]|nr:SpoIVB peptidase [Halanaerobiales bacterium]